MDVEQQLDQLLNLDSENEVVEFKSASIQYDFNRIGKYFSALSNEANLVGVNAGWLVFGIDDSHNIVGTKFRESTSYLNSLKAEIADQTTSSITFTEIYVILRSGRRVVMFQIPPAPQGMPIAWKGHYYGRNHESLAALNIEELERIRNQVANDWSAEVCQEGRISDLSNDAIARSKELFIQKNPKFKDEAEGWSDEAFLDKAKLTVKGKITRTALILLGKPEASHQLSPAHPTISWILKDKDDVNRDYEHFTLPFILSIEALYQKIRNLKYRYIREDNLFPEEVDQYDPYLIREALHNCIAHQDYRVGAKIIVVEYEDGQLIFSNKGKFIPQSIETVINSDSPESKYRNPFLANAMVNINMIDTVGSGIKRMFNIQQAKYFPLPEYELENESVKVTLIGKVLDINYARKLAQLDNLDLNDIVLLDRVQKKMTITREQAKYLKSKKLIEGRKPNFYISANVAKVTSQGTNYLAKRGIDDNYCRKIILEYIDKLGAASKKDLENLLMDKLSSGLSDDQKRNKIKNNLQSLRSSGVIRLGEGRKWVSSKSSK